MTTPTTDTSTETADETAADTDADTDAVASVCRLCGEPLLLRRPGRDTCARHPEVREDMVGLPQA